MADANGKTGGLLSGLKGLVFEDEPEKPQAASAPPVTPKPAVVKGTVPTSVEEVDPQIRSLIEADVGQAAKPAYSEFKTIEESLRPVIPDEAMRFKAAITMVTSQKGQKAEQILVDVEECLAAVAGKETEADKAAEVARRQLTDQSGKESAARRQRIAELQQELAKLEVAEDRHQADVEKKLAEINSTHQKFSQGVDAYRAELNAVKNKLTANLKGA